MLTISKAKEYTLNYFAQFDPFCVRITNAWYTEDFGETLVIVEFIEVCQGAEYLYTMQCWYDPATDQIKGEY